MALPYLPSEYIFPVFNSLRNENNEPVIEELMTYVHSTWIESTNWKPSAWLVFGRFVTLSLISECLWNHRNVLQLLWQAYKWKISNVLIFFNSRSVSTNNDIDDWHHRLNRKANGKTHFPFYHLVKLLHSEAILTKLQVRLVSEEKLTRMQRQKYLNLQANIFRLWDNSTTIKLMNFNLYNAVHAFRCQQLIIDWDRPPERTNAIFQCLRVFRSKWLKNFSRRQKH